MNLEIPHEPISLKEFMKRGLEAHRELEIANLKQGTWLASPLWSGMGWGRELKEHDITWQKFTVIVRDHFPYFLDWAMEKASWGEAMGKLVERIEDEVTAIKKGQGGVRW